MSPELGLDSLLGSNDIEAQAQETTPNSRMMHFRARPKLRSAPLAVSPRRSSMYGVGQLGVRKEMAWAA